MRKETKIFTVYDLYEKQIIASFTDEQDAYRRAKKEIQDIIEGEMDEFYPNQIEVTSALHPYTMSYVDSGGYSMDYMLVGASTLIEDVK